MEQKSLKWGILGASRIFEKIYAEICASPQHILHGIAARNPERAKDFKTRFHFRKSYTSYEELLDDTEIDAVYIALPNALHKTWILKALEKNKAVLCEKPLVTALEDFQRVQTLAKDKKLLLMEGMMYRLHPQIQDLENKIITGALGKLQTLRGEFFIPERPPNDIRMNPQLGGGVQWDLGCYLSHLIRILEPSKIIEVSKETKSQNGVITYLKATIRFQSGCTAELACGFEGARREHFEVIGSQKTILLEKPFKPDNSTLYRNEFEHFYNLFYGSPSSKLSLEESFKSLELLSALEN